MENAEKKIKNWLPIKDRGQLVVPKKTPWPAVPVVQNGIINQSIFYDLKEIILRIRKQNLSTRDLAYEVIDFFENMVRFETGLESVRRGLPLALAKLCAGRVWSTLASGVFQWAERTIAARDDNSAVDYHTLLNDLADIIDWYSMRRISLEKLESISSIEDQLDQIFDIAVLHDQYQHGHHGYVVRAGIALYGRSRQNLWLKTYVIHDGAYVLARPGWESWIDDTEIFSHPRDHSSSAFSAIVPISPVEQRTILDNVEIFIPYSALDLVADKQEVEIEVCLFSEKGEQIVRAAAHDSLSVFPYGQETHPMLSYQARGIWPEDAISGDSIKNIVAAFERSSVIHKSAGRIKLTMDLEILGHVNEEIVAEVRCFRKNGDLISNVNPAAKDQSVVSRTNVQSKRPIARIKDYSINIDLKHIDLDAADEEILCEICIIGQFEKILCGSMVEAVLPANYASLARETRNSKPNFLNKLFPTFFGSI